MRSLMAHQINVFSSHIGCCDWLEFFIADRVLILCIQPVLTGSNSNVGFILIDLGLISFNFLLSLIVNFRFSPAGTIAYHT